jgi:hypothetical protein
MEYFALMFFFHALRSGFEGGLSCIFLYCFENNLE